jgi:hypothetical protein
MGSKYCSPNRESRKGETKRKKPANDEDSNQVEDVTLVALETARGTLKRKASARYCMYVNYSAYENVFFNIRNDQAFSC